MKYNRNNSAACSVTWEREGNKIQENEIRKYFLIGGSSRSFRICNGCFMLVHDYIMQRTSGIKWIDQCHCSFWSYPPFCLLSAESTAAGRALREEVRANGSGTLLPKSYWFMPAWNIVFGVTPTTVHDLAHTSRAVGDWWNHVTSGHDATVLSNVHGQCSPAFSAGIT